MVKKRVVIVIFLLIIGAGLIPNIVGETNKNFNNKAYLKNNNSDKNLLNLDSELEGYWNFNDGTAIDISGNNRDGIIYNATYYNTGGPDNSGYLEFDGWGDFVDIPNTNGLDFNDEDFSLSCWIQIFHNYNEYYYFVSLGDPEYDNRRYANIGKYRSGAQNGSLIALLYNGEWSGASVKSDLNGTELPKYQWFHLVGVYDHSNHELKMYYNANLQSDIKYLDDFDLSCSPLKFNIGRTITTYGPGYHWGKIDEVRIHSRALSQSDISGLYNFIYSNLDCSGNLEWAEIEPGSTVSGTIELKNVGETDSLLDWEVDSFPSWGDWSFDPINGTGLIAGDSITINVDVVAPNEEETFTGEVVLVNTENPEDYCIINIDLTTPRNKPYNSYFNLLSWLFERFSNVFPPLRYIQGLQ
jgi:hypothetical protein